MSIIHTELMLLTALPMIAMTCWLVWEEKTVYNRK